MNFMEITRLLLSKASDTTVSDGDWDKLVEQAFLALQETYDISEIISSLEMDVLSGFSMPEKLRRVTIERRLELGDLTSESLWQYVSHLEMYFKHRSLFEWLRTRLDSMSQGEHSKEKYVALGEELLSRIYAIRNNSK